MTIARSRDVPSRSRCVPRADLEALRSFREREAFTLTGAFPPP